VALAENVSLIYVSHMASHAFPQLFSVSVRLMTIIKPLPPIDQVGRTHITFLDFSLSETSRIRKNRGPEGNYQVTSYSE
jgi:hypothetical protein